MFAKYNCENFPCVFIDLSGTIESDSDFTDFTKKWLQLYERKQDFELIFETKNIGLISPIYSIYTGLFIRSLKKMNPQYLKKSKIIVHNNFVYYLLKLVFSIESPVANVEIIFNNKSEFIVPKQKYTNKY